MTEEKFHEILIRIDRLEQKQIERDEKVDRILSKLDEVRDWFNKKVFGNGEEGFAQRLLKLEWGESNRAKRSAWVAGIIAAVISGLVVALLKLFIP